MDLPWLLIAVAALIIILLVVFLMRKDKDRGKLTTLTSISFVLIIAGAANGDDRLIAYSLFGAGILLSIIDIFLRKK